MPDPPKWLPDSSDESELPEEPVTNGFAGAEYAYPPDDPLDPLDPGVPDPLEPPDAPLPELCLLPDEPLELPGIVKCPTPLEEPTLPLVFLDPLVLPGEPCPLDLLP